MSVLLTFEDETPWAQWLARALGWPCRFIEQHRFPVGNGRRRLRMS